MGPAPSSTIGLDKIKALTGIVDEVKKNHPETYQRFGGDKGLTGKLGRMYLSKKFSEGTRSQEAIRRVKAAIKSLPKNAGPVQSYFENEWAHTLMEDFAPAKSNNKDIRSVCQNLSKLLLEADADNLDVDELRILKRINVQIHSLLDEAGSI